MINRNIYSDTTQTETNLSQDFIWRGLSLSGRAHPLTGDIVYVDDMEDIKLAIRNIVLTSPNERPFSKSDVSTSVRDQLFALMTAGLDIEVKEEIMRKLIRYEPRAFIVGVQVLMYPTKHAVEIVIAFRKKGTQQTANVTIFLERT